MSGLLGRISAMLEVAPGPAVAAAFLWGLASVLLSPCHLVSLPLLVGYLSARAEADVGRAAGAAGLSAVFVSGILVTVAAVGAGTAAAGRLLGDVGPAGTRVSGALLVLFGLFLLGLLPLPSVSTAAAARVRGRGLWPVFIIGLVFGVGLGPCTFAFMAPVLVLALGSAGERPGFAAALLGAFAAGHSALIVAAGSLSQTVRRYLNWDSRSRGTLWMRRACGVLVVAGGVYLIAG